MRGQRTRRYYQAPIGGSPPRVRGQHDHLRVRRVTVRFTPARAGTTQVLNFRAIAIAVHPRACGDNVRWVRAYPRVAVHPRACGDNGRDEFRDCLGHGSPPRVRGQRAFHRPVSCPMRFTPARAGTTSIPDRPQPWRSVHPRACGDNAEALRQNRPGHGSPPRVRGQLPRGNAAVAKRRFTPARAGTTGVYTFTQYNAYGTPARAGTTIRERGIQGDAPVHPRACGDNIVPSCLATNIHRFTPACAGTTLQGISGT